MTPGDGNRSALSRMLQPTPACIPLERLGETPTDAEREHVELCARCQAELALWEEFEDSTPSPDEGAAVQWVVAELGRRCGGNLPVPAVDRVRRWLSLPRFAAAAATLAIAGVIGYGLWDPEPPVRPYEDAKTYRTVGLQAISPVGDVADAPRALEWMAVAGAVGYNVQVMEVDRTTLWRGSTSGSRLEMPSQVTAQLVSGKTVLWEVTARDRAGASIAESGTQRFRVTTVPRPLRNP